MEIGRIFAEKTAIVRLPFGTAWQALSHTDYISSWREIRHSKPRSLANAELSWQGLRTSQAKAHGNRMDIRRENRDCRPVFRHSFAGSLGRGLYLELAGNLA